MFQTYNEVGVPRLDSLSWEFTSEIGPNSTYPELHDAMGISMDWLKIYRNP